jgi:two-component system phosphate regulon sensor histidine kinase PhoR
MSFRQKILLGYLVVFLLFLSLMSPFSSLVVRHVVQKAMENRALELIERLKEAKNDQELLVKLKELKPLIFFRMSVITGERAVLYDSHTKRIIGGSFDQNYIVNHPEVLEALKTGKGYAEDYSELLSQKFAYTAVAFNFHGKTYVLRTAFPYRYVKELNDDFEFGFIVLTSVVLILYSLMTWFVINHLTKPIQAIISTVSTYREGEVNPLRELRDLADKSKDDVGVLAKTLVSLSERLEKQISSLRNERNEKEMVLQSLVEGVIAVDRKMVVTFANDTALKLLGKNREEVILKPFDDLHNENLAGMLTRCQLEEKPIVESAQVQAKGVTYYLEVVAAPKMDNTGAVLIMEDKSAHYRIIEMRKDFIANASHELKTPITIIRGFAETLHDNPELPLEMTQDITGKIVRNCERMATIVRDLLALADIENIPQSHLSSIEIELLAQKIKTQILQVHVEAEITIQAKSQVVIKGDHDLIEMALSNLMENAVKYSNVPAKVHVNISQNDGNAIIQVQDAGIGIPKEDLSRIFERFYRVDKAHSRKVGGSGLGLSIVETIIKKHFGTITVESELGQGSTFTITLPLQA